MLQHYINPGGYEKEISRLLQQLGVKHMLLVCGKSFFSLPVSGFIQSLQDKGRVTVTYFKDFKPNPQYSDVLKGIKVFNENHCDFILAVGGGSAIDVAKCIKLSAKEVPLFAVPTTAGSGSEATHFAVVYKDGKKRSVAHENLLPQYVLLYPDNLVTLPVYQKKAAACDALAHAVESYWSLHSSKESRKLCETVIHLIVHCVDGYLDNDRKCLRRMMLAAHLSGQAINMTKTTAAHAMSYKMTEIFGIAHGHAVMLCLPEVWEYMLKNVRLCVDERGLRYLQEMFYSLAGCFGQETPEGAIRALKELRVRMGLRLPDFKEKQLELLADSVNPERLANSPVILAKDDLRQIYRKVLVRIE